MQKIDIRKHKHLLFGFACGLAIMGLYFVGSGDLGMRAGSPVASAAIPVLTEPSVDPYVRGWAWSSNIGWISFDCRDIGACTASTIENSYSTKLNLTTGTVTGGPNQHFAWSSNIGWIDTNPAGPYPAAGPNHGFRVDMNTGVISGWIRAVSRGGGWDGWIKVTNAKVSQGGFVKNATAYGSNPAESTGGWMWGSDVVGWVTTWAGGANDVHLPAADCAFGVDPGTITPPQAVTLAWKCNSLVTQNTCSIDNGVGNNFPRQGNRNANPTAPTTYTLTCQGFGGPVVKSVSVNVAGRIRIIEVTPGQ